jgi:oxalate decarboxylase/phosphoglucose isomerase-like protein (cupin superfamily)
VFDWGTIKWLVTPHLDEGAGLTTGEVGDGEPPFPIREGDAVYIPAATLHSTYNTTWRLLRLVVVYTPGGAETALDALPDARILEPGLVPQWTQDR